MRWAHRASLPPRAFALIELVIVLAIIGIIAAMALPRFAGANAHYRAELAAKRLQRDLQYARQLAITRSTAQQVTFNTAAGTYELIGQPDPDRPTKPYLITLSDSPYRVKISSANFGGGPTLTFNGFGVPTSGTGGVRLTHGDWKYDVFVEAGTGMVYVK